MEKTVPSPSRVPLNHFHNTNERQRGGTTDIRYFRVTTVGRDVYKGGRNKNPNNAKKTKKKLSLLLGHN